MNQKSGFLFFGCEAGDQEKEGCDADGGVGDVERGPVTIPRKDDVEEIDNKAVEEAVGEIAEDS